MTRITKPIWTIVTATAIAVGGLFVAASDLLAMESTYAIAETGDGEQICSDKPGTDCDEPGT